MYQAAGQINIDDKNEIHFVMNIPTEVGKPDQPIWELSELYHVKKISPDSGYTVNITTMIDIVTTHPNFSNLRGSNDLARLYRHMCRN
jgi:hypothetical protein